MRNNVIVIPSSPLVEGDLDMRNSFRDLEFEVRHGWSRL